MINWTTSGFHKPEGQSSASDWGSAFNTESKLEAVTAILAHGVERSTGEQEDGTVKNASNAAGTLFFAVYANL